jgi:hypothetical protein
VAYPSQAKRKAALERLRRICRALPETSERLSHGAPSFFVRDKKCFLMLLDDHHGDGRFAIWCAAAAREPGAPYRGERRPLLPAALRRAPRLARRAPE